MLDHALPLGVVEAEPALHRLRREAAVREGEEHAAAGPQDAVELADLSFSKKLAC